jgi:hypothetical protein
MGRYATFVVRILLNDESKSIIQGQITHVGSQTSIYFKEISKAVAFVEQNMWLAPESIGTESRDNNTTAKEEM